jgi:hypothetical protein
MKQILFLSTRGHAPLFARLLVYLLTCLLVYSSTLSAQEKIIVHQRNSVLYQTTVSEIEDIRLQNNDFFVNNTNGTQAALPISAIDSITFENEPVFADNIIRITVDGSQATVVNPYENRGVTVTTAQAHVSLTATDLPDVECILSGNTGNGSLTIQSNQGIRLTLNGLQLTNPTGTALQINSGSYPATINIANASYLSDGTGSTKNAVLIAQSPLVFTGDGSLQITALAKHAVSGSKAITVESGNITIPAAVSDGFHSEGFILNGGSLNIAASGDGIDAGAGPLEINAGAIQITSSVDDTKGIKTDDVLTVNGGTINMTVAGAQSKGLSSKKDILIRNGNISIITSGAAVLGASGSGYDPSYCTAIKADQSITINNGTLSIESRSAATGGKGLSADGDVIINGGNITISTAGNGAVYTNSSGTADSYTACCIKSDTNIYLLGGNITCSSSGTGGKAIAADATLTIGNAGANNANLTLNASTSGQRFAVSSGGSGGGGGRPGGGGGGTTADYANPKAIKSEGNLTINSGVIRVNCTQTTEGGEGIESKATLTINGGDVEVHTYDDCINAANHIAINGGSTYCVSTGNDAIDSNGTLTITGGLTIAGGTRSPEEGFDCDNNTFTISGGIIVGTGGATSSPTTNACTQRSIKYTGTAGNAICLKNSAGEIILLYKMPAFSSSGGGGQGGSSMVVLFTDPRLSNGSYTLQYGGTISGGDNVNGYYTGGSYSGGSTKTFTISSMLTTVTTQ